MSKVVLYMSMSVDGFITGPDDGMEHGLGVDGERLHAWLSDGGVDPGSYRPVGGPSATVFDELMATGAVIVGPGRTGRAAPALPRTAGGLRRWRTSGSTTCRPGTSSSTWFAG